MSDINYTFGKDYFSTVSSAGLVPTNSARVTDNSDTSLSQLLEMAMRPNFLTQYTWTSTSTYQAFTFPKCINMPAITSQNTFLRQILSMFAFSKFSLRFRFKVNGSPFHMGLLQAFFVPAYTPSPILATYNDFERCMVYPSIRMNACGTSEYVLDVPSLFDGYYHNHSLQIFSTTNPFKQLGDMIIVPLVPLLYSAGSTTSIGVTITYEFTNLQVAGPTILYPTPTTLYREDDKIDEKLDKMKLEHQGLTDAIMDPISGAAKSVVGDALDGASSFAKNTAKTIVGSIPLVGPLISSFMDKPPLRTEPLSISKHAASGWVHGEGNYTGVTLSVTPGLVRPPQEEEVGKIGTISDYIKIPTLLLQLSFDSTTTPGTRLFDWAINPSYPYQQLVPPPSLFTASLQVYDTPLSYMSHIYEKWRGSLEYTIEIICTAATTCTVALAWVPDEDIGNVAFNTWSKIAGQCSVWQIDVNGPTVSRVKVPFFHDQRFKNVLHPDTGYPYNVKFYDDPTNTTGIDGVTYANGSMALYLLNQVQNNIAAPSLVWFRLYVKAGDDFEYALPGGCLNNIYAYNEVNPDFEKELLGYKDAGKVPVIANRRDLPRVPISEYRENREKEIKNEKRPVVPDKKDIQHQGITDDTPVSEEQVVPVSEPEKKAESIVTQDVKIDPYFGESHMNYSVMKRFQLLYRTVMTPDSNASTNFYYNQLAYTFPVSPTLMSYAGLTGTQNDLYLTPTFSTIMNHVGRAHRYWRGSLNYRFVVRSSVAMVLKAYYVPYKSMYKFALTGKYVKVPNPFTDAAGTSVFQCSAPGYSTVFKPYDLAGADVNNDFNDAARRFITFAGRCGSEGIELGTTYDGSVLDVNVPYWCEKPVSLTDSYTLSNSSQLLCSAQACLSGMESSHGQIVLVIDTGYEALPYSGALDRILIEVYVSAGDDLVFTYPVMPPPLKMVKGTPSGFILPP